MRDTSAVKRSGRARRDRGFRIGFSSWVLLISFAFTLDQDVALGGAEKSDSDADARGTTIALERVIDERSLSRKRGRWHKWLTGRTSGGTLSRPYALAWEGSALLVADPGAGRVLRIDKKDRVEISPDGAFVSPVGIAVCQPGIVVADSVRGDITVLDRTLAVTRRIASGLGRPTGVACSEDRIFVAETALHRILVFDASTESSAPMAAFGIRGGEPGEFNFPTALSWSHGILWVGDSMNFRIQKIDSSQGEPLDAFGQLGDASGEMPRIKGIAVDDRDRVWISDAHLNEIALYSSEGVYLRKLGSLGGLPGMFSFPAGIAIGQHGQVAVADSLNRRVQVFKIESNRAAR